MSTSSRRLSAKAKTSKPSHTPGKTKGATCQKSDLKTFGMSANPYKLSGFNAQRYTQYCQHVDSLGGNKR